MKEIIPFIMFSGNQHGRAREAVEFYVSLFPNASLVRMDFEDGRQPGSGTLDRDRVVFMETESWTH
ncbi:MAG: VOC family protein [Gammaproteobacteria bacterium]|nr:VOC family protein [Gammaproteobacteria bacterium]